jgi:hypothetical protein
MPQQMQMDSKGKLWAIGPDGSKVPVDETPAEKVTAQVQQQQAPEQDSWLDTGLKTAGGIVGGIAGGAGGLLVGGPVGAYAGGIGGSGLGEAVGGAIGDLSLKDFGSDMLNGAKWGAAGAAVGPAMRLGGKALRMAGPTIGGMAGTLAGVATGHPFVGGPIGAGVGKAGKMAAPYIERAGQAWDDMLKSVVGGASKRMGSVAASAPKAAAPFESGATKAGLGRVPTEGGGIVKGSGQPATITSKAAGHADEAPSNLQKLGRDEFTEVEKRANMFGGAKVPGLAVKPNARVPLSTQEEVEQLIQEIMNGKTGGSLPNNAPRGAKLRSPK